MERQSSQRRAYNKIPEQALGAWMTNGARFLRLEYYHIFPVGRAKTASTMRCAWCKSVCVCVSE